MTVIEMGCHKLHEFVDGELSHDEAERFRVHLAGCSRCGAELPRFLELVAACVEHAPTSAADGLAGRARRRARFVRAALLLASAAAVAAISLLIWHRSPSVEPPLLTASLSASRTIEVRLSYPPLEGYRPYRVTRGDAAREDIPLESLLKLKRAEDWHGLGVVSLLNGDRSAAVRYLERAQSSESVEADRAALDLLDGSHAALDRALTNLDAILAREPSNHVARWNRALALVRMDRPLAAADDFERVAAGGEPGWAAEAAQRAGVLRSIVETTAVPAGR